MQTNPAHERLPAPSGKRSSAALELTVLLLLTLLLAIDLIADSAGTSARHIAIEIAAAAFAIAAAVHVWLRWMAARRQLEQRVDELGASLHVASAEAERWRAEAREALEGLGAAIDKQCDRWGLSDAEREVEHHEEDDDG